MTKIAILGFGTVGSGVYEVLKTNGSWVQKRAAEPVEVKYVLDIRDFSGHPEKEIFVNEIDTILNDPEITTVVESIGGLNPAYYYVRSALQAGKNVVTSNKELVAEKGAELLALAKSRKVCFLFEASVGGGTPVITPIHQCLCANTIEEIAGIVNGTTNFILTKMAAEGLSFEEALKEAQNLGYAETIDPSADVDGIDAARKLAILASLAFGTQIKPASIPTRGIRAVTAEDLKILKKEGAAIKLIAHARREEGGAVSCEVEPMVLLREDQLAGVNDVFNAVQVTGDMLGEVMFYGKGAGKLPTASAVVADIVDAIRIGPRIHDTLFWLPAEEEKNLLTSFGQNAYYIRTKGEKNTAVIKKLKETLPGCRVLQAEPLALFTPPLTEEQLLEFCGWLAQEGAEPLAGFKVKGEAAHV